MTPEVLSHFDDRGAARMVDVSGKSATVRYAVAGGSVQVSVETFQRIVQGTVKKGDVLQVARLAGIMAAKRTPDLIPLCHPLPLSSVSLEFSLDHDEHRIDVEAHVRVKAETGVEMEALTAVSVACLTIYDMCKAMDKGMKIGEIRLIRKEGGKSGTYVGEESKTR